MRLSYYNEVTIFFNTLLVKLKIYMGFITTSLMQIV